MLLYNVEYSEMKIVIGLFFKLSQAFWNPFDPFGMNPMFHYTNLMPDEYRIPPPDVFDPDTQCNGFGKCKRLKPYVDDCWKRCGDTGGYCGLLKVTVTDRYDPNMSRMCGYCCSGTKSNLNSYCPPKARVFSHKSTKMSKNKIDF